MKSPVKQKPRGRCSTQEPVEVYAQTQEPVEVQSSDNEVADMVDRKEIHAQVAKSPTSPVINAHEVSEAYNPVPSIVINNP